MKQTLLAISPICNFCSSSENLVLDHIIPINIQAKLLSVNVSDEYRVTSLENLQLLCLSCKKLKDNFHQSLSHNIYKGADKKNNYQERVKKYCEDKKKLYKIHHEYGVPYFFNAEFDNKKYQKFLSELVDKNDVWEILFNHDLAYTINDDALIMVGCRQHKLSFEYCLCQNVGVNIKNFFVSIYKNEKFKGLFEKYNLKVGLDA